MTKFEKMEKMLEDAGYEECYDYDWFGVYKWDDIYIRLNTTTGEPEDRYVLPEALRFREDVWGLEYDIDKMEDDFKYFCEKWEKLQEE